MAAPRTPPPGAPRAAILAPRLHFPCGTAARAGDVRHLTAPSSPGAAGLNEPAARELSAMSGTPIRGTPGGTPLSPTRISRLQEKEELRRATAEEKKGRERKGGRVPRAAGREHCGCARSRSSGANGGLGALYHVTCRARPAQSGCAPCCSGPLRVTFRFCPRRTPLRAGN